MEERHKAPDPVWYTRFWQCHECGRDCRDVPEDDAPHRDFGLCAGCLARWRESLPVHQDQESGQKHGDAADSGSGAIL